MRALSARIVSDLAAKLGKQESTIKKDIYSLRKSYPGSTVNAVAQIYAQSCGVTVFRKLDKEDRASLPMIEIERKKITVKRKDAKRIKTEKRIVELISYETTDYFRKGHILEINKAYTHGCYTSVFILLRKIVENMLIDILKHRFPPTTKTNKQLYFDTDKNQFKDFNVILKNFRGKSAAFGVDKKLAERIAALAQSLKDKANDKAHSWFHLVKKKSEIDELDPQTLMELISQLEKNTGMK